MKHIVYLTSWLWDRALPFLVTTEANITPGNQWYLIRDFGPDVRYKGAITHPLVRCPADIHRIINDRAELLHNASPTGRNETGGRSVYPSWFMSDERIARSRFRKAKRNRRTKRRDTTAMDGYACIDISFGLLDRGDSFNFTHQELTHIKDRLYLAARDRRPLSPWRLCDCWNENQAA